MNFSTFQEVTVDLAANEETKRHVFGSFLRVIASTDDFEIGVSGEEWISGFAGLGIASEVDPQTGERPTFQELRFRETKGVSNSIRVIVGTGQIFDDRVVFGGTNVPVDVQSLPSISFNGAQPVSQNGVWNVGVTGLPSISFNGAQPVSQNGVWNVGVTGLPSISFNGAQPINQGSPNDWRTPGANDLATYADALVGAGLAGILLGALPGRKRAVLTNNGTETVFLRHSAVLAAEGIPLVPGESMSIETTDAVYVANPSLVGVPVGRYEEHWI